MKPLITISLVFLGILVYSECAVNRNKEKIYHKYRPQKEKALFEKGEERELEGGFSGEEEDDDDENSIFGIDLNNLFSNNNRRQAKNLFSGLWEKLLGQFQGNQSSLAFPRGENSGGETDFFKRVIQIMRPWWKGENVCSREEEEEKDEEEDSGNFFSSLLTSCQDLQTAYKCTMKIGKDGKIKVKTLTYECCHGWTRGPEDRGCTQEIKMEDTASTLEKMNLTKFLESVQSLGLEEKIQNENLTLFVPTNDALSRVTDSEEISFVLLETEDKMQFVREIMMAHILPGWQFSYEWRDEDTLPTEKTGSSVRVNHYSYPTRFTTVNCARLVTANRQTTTGLIHTVDRVMMPARQSIWEILGSDARFSKFASMVSEELQEKLLNTDEDLTVLAFTDEEFEKLPDDLQERMLSKEGCFQDYIRQLIIPHTICSAAVQSDAVVRNLAGKMLNATIETEGEENGAVSFNGIPIAAADRVATNGVIHVMAGVIMLPHMLEGLEVAEKENGEVFAELIRANELEDLPNPVTLFIPPNEALMNSNLNEESEEDRKKVLSNHIVESLAVVSGRNPEMIVETKAGKELTITTSPFNPLTLFGGRGRSSASIGCARILRSNVQACNGLLHFIDRILTIPKESVMERLRAREDLSQFLSLLEMSELDEELDENFSGTLLVPTNQAFQRHFPPEKTEKLLEEPEKLKAFLKQHILKEQVCCHSMGSSLFFRQKRMETLSGSNLISSGSGNRKRIGGSFIKECDDLATNGIIHTLDRPIVRRRATSILDMFSQAGERFNWNIDWPF